MSWFLRISGTVAFGFIEWLLLALIWAIQIGAVLILAAFLALLVQKAEEAIRTKKVKFLPRMLIVFLLLCVILAGFALRPPVTCGDGVCTDLTPDLRETVRSVSSGLYSWNVPLVPICVRITETEDFVVNGVTEHRVEFDVYYFCFGRLGMEYSTCDGFNIATPIFRS